MAEVQKDTESGEMTQRFIEFVMMHAQQAALCLGQIPNPQTGKAEVHLDVARIFIDQLQMIRSKTKGNLTEAELGVLNNAISNLQIAFVEVSKAGGGAPEEGQEKEAPESAASEGAAPQAPTGTPEGGAAGDESKKKFTKSYGS